MPHLLGDGGVDHLLHYVLPEGLQGDLLAVLAGDDHGVDLDWDAGSLLELVLGGDLGLAVRPGPPEGAVTSELGDLPVHLVRELEGEWYVLRCLVSGVAEHQAL